MSVQETRGRERPVDKEPTASVAEPAGPEFQPQSVTPKPAGPEVTAEAPRRPKNKGQAASDPKIQAAAAAPSEKRDEKLAEAPATPNFERLGLNLARLMEQGSRALAAYFDPSQSNKGTDLSDQLTDAYRALSPITAHWLRDPARTLQAQTALTTKFLGLWANSLRRWSGEKDEPVVPLDPSDKRFAAPEWRDGPYFDFLRQAHAITSQWAEELIRRSTDVDRSHPSGVYRLRSGHKKTLRDLLDRGTCSEGVYDDIRIGHSNPLTLLRSCGHGRSIWPPRPLFRAPSAN